MTPPAAGPHARALAIDIGGTKMAGALVDTDGKVHCRRQVATSPDPAAAPAQLVDEVLGSVSDLETMAGVGAGCGGPDELARRSRESLEHSEWRGGFPLRQWLRERLPGVVVRVHNDALCVVAGETWWGAATGLRDVLGMVVSTGVGGGLVLDGRLRDGRTGNAGHIGHVIAEPGGPVCGCGARGCLEAVARGPMVVAWAAERGCTARDGRELAELARRGDPIAVAAFDRAGSAVGRVVAGVVALLELDAVVIGGGLTSAGDLLFGPLHREYAAHAQLRYTRDTPVRMTGLGQDAGLVGAAALVLAADRFWSGD